MLTLRYHLYALSLLDELGPFMTLYALWFADHGMSIQQVSAVFAVWAGVALVAEVPTGVLADWMDRRAVLAAGVVLRTAGIAVFLLWPTFWGFVVGAGLWAVQIATSSGAWEATVHEGLSRTGDVDAYETVMARCGQFNQGGVAVGTASAAALLAGGVSLSALGWATVCVAVPTVWLFTRLPASTAPPEASDDEPGFVEQLVQGLRHAQRSRALLSLLALGAVIEGLFIFDEYVPALGVAVGTPDAAVPLLLLSLWAGLIAGGEVVARRPGMRSGVLGAILAVGALTGLVGLFLRHPVGVCLLGITFGSMNIVWIALDARLQAEVDDGVRATIGSTRSFVGSVINLGVFAGFGVAIVGADPTPGLVAGLCALVVVAAGVSFAAGRSRPGRA